MTMRPREEEEEHERRELSEDTDDEWGELRRFDDPISADLIRDFLADHDVRVAIRGNTQATRMTWSQTSDVIRIVVARGDVDRACEALAAMNTSEAHPFRGPSAPASDDEENDARAFVKPRSVIAAPVLALLVPIGAGHFFARHGAAGIVLGAGIVVSVFGSIFGGVTALALAWPILVVVDAVASVSAVRRYNEERVPSDAVQRRWAIAAVVAALAIAWLSAR